MGDRRVYRYGGVARVGYDRSDGRVGVMTVSGEERYEGHVVPRKSKEWNKSEMCIRVAEALGQSGTETAIMIARLEEAGYEIRLKADRA